MKIKTTRKATADEEAAILEGMDYRAECLAAIRRHISPEMLATAFASLPPDAQQRLTRLRLEPPTRLKVRLITRKRQAKKP